MNGVRLTPPQVRAIARVWTGTPKNEARLGKLYGVGRRALRLIARRGGNKRAKKKLVRWTAEAVAILRERYAGTPTTQLVRELRRDYQAIWRKARELGLHKSDAVVASERTKKNRILARAGAKYRYKKGQIPPNKGKRMPPGWAPGRMRETQFKKGERSGKAAEHYLPVGAERDIEGWLYRKVADVPNVAYTVNWQPVHRLIWMEANGPVPEGHVLKFKDRDRRNFDLRNIVLTSFEDNMRGNSIHRYPPELRSLIRLQGKLERTIEQRVAA